MSYLKVNPEGLVTSASGITSAAERAAAPTGIAVTPPSSDPVSLSVTATLQSRLAGLTAYSRAAAAITTVRGQMVSSSATVYTEQEDLNRGSLSTTGAGSGGSAPPPPAPADVPIPTVPQVSVPTIPAPPGTGREIAELVHGGPGSQAMLATAQQLRQQADELRSTSTTLRAHAGHLSTDWPSESGQQVSTRIDELARWYDAHAQHTTEAADSFQGYAESFASATGKIPTPQQFHDVEQKLQAAAQANANPANRGMYAPVVARLQTELAELNTKAMGGWGDIARAGGDPSVTGNPLSPPPRPQKGGVQAVDYDVPLSPVIDDDPPHGQDPRYWIDVNKAIHVPPDQLAPWGYKQIGPDLWYPSNLDTEQYNVSPPPNPVKHPLDMADIVGPDPKTGLGPHDSTELAPGYFARKQSSLWPEINAPEPQRPIDIRDIIHIQQGPPGSPPVLAPNGYEEYLPGWWAPNPMAGGPR